MSAVRVSILIVLAWLAAFALVAVAHAADPFPKKYDEAIRSAWAEYFPGDDWTWWKAQLVQESRLDPNARSPVGALGVAQFMPATWEEITKAMRLGAVDRRMAEPSIRAGAFYMRRLVYVWRAPRTALSRRQLAQASYNCGPGGVIRAQRRCSEAREYSPIAPCLPSESRIYVERIARWRGMML